MKFTYIGDEPTEWFGFQWVRGVTHDVTDEHAVKKLTISALFEPADAKAEVLDDKPRRGRPKKVEAEPEIAENDDADAG